MNANVASPIITERVDDYARVSVVSPYAVIPAPTTLFTVPPSKKWVDITVYMSIKQIENGTYTSYDVYGTSGPMYARLLINAALSAAGIGILQHINLAPWKHSLEVPIEKEIFGGQRLQVSVDLVTGAFNAVTIPRLDFVFRYTGRLIDDRQGAGKVMEGVAPYSEQVQCVCPYLREYMFKKHEYAGK